MSSDSASTLRIGVDVGGTFTDCVAFDGQTLRVIKLPSTPTNFERAVIDAVQRAATNGADVEVIHGSTVATNALLERKVEPVAFITTEGFRDMLLIGRQNRPKLYALRIVRPQPLADEANWYTVRERIGAAGEVVTPLEEAEADRVVREIVRRGLQHVAICLLFSFVNPSHERLLADRCRKAGLTVSLSSDVLPEFREYERASTTVMNAALGPRVEKYLGDLEAGIPRTPISIISSTGGTLSIGEAGASAARLILSGPAGGVMGAALMAKAAGIENVITYDMGGTSTDVATIVAGHPQWTTSSTVDGLPIGLPTLDIHTVGAGGGSVAWLDAGGALRVGPRSAGAQPGPACYARGGTEPTVTDANLLLGRLLPDHFAGGQMRINPELAREAIASLAAAMNKSIDETAAGIVRVAEENMSRAIRAVTSRRGLDPREFALMSFGGAGGLHACGLAGSLEIPQVIVPPYCGVLSALGMVAAPPTADASKTVLHLGESLDDHRLYAEFGYLNMLASEKLPQDQLAAVEAYADLRFAGQSYELTVKAKGADRAALEEGFREAYAARYGTLPTGKAIEIVTLRLRRVGRVPSMELPQLMATSRAFPRGAMTRAALRDAGETTGPFLLIDDEATTYVPAGWSGACDARGIVVLRRTST